MSSFPASRRDERFINEEVRIAALTPGALQSAAERLFSPGNVVYVRDADRQAEINAE